MTQGPACAMPAALAPMRILRVLSLLSLFSLPGFCGTGTVTIVYTGISATPTLSQTMLIALALLLPVIAFRAVRKTSLPLMVLAVAAGLTALEVLTGHRFFPSAQAAIPVNIDLSTPTGVTVVQAINFSQFLVVRNTT